MNVVLERWTEGIAEAQRENKPGASMSNWEGWHFLPEDRRLAHGDGREVKVGETLVVEGPPILCERGLHASKRALDALENAPGPIVCRVRLGGEIVEDKTKACATERTVLWMADATRALHEFALWCAEGALRARNVTDERSWNALAVKRRWLDGEVAEGGLAAVSAAAWDVAKNVARDAAGTAARAAAWAAAWAAARDTAWYAAWAAARDTAKAAAWAAARDTTWDNNTSCDDPRHAARAVAMDAAWAAAWAAALDCQNTELERRLWALREG
jgi:hypothetical protein